MSGRFKTWLIFLFIKANVRLLARISREKEGFLFFNKVPLDPMDFYNTRDTYILCKGEVSLWCNRANGNLQVRPGLKWNITVTKQERTFFLTCRCQICLSKIIERSCFTVFFGYKQISTLYCVLCIAFAGFNENVKIFLLFKSMRLNIWYDFSFRDARSADRAKMFGVSAWCGWKDKIFARFEDSSWNVYNH